MFFEHLRSEEATHRSQLATFRNYFSHGQKAEARDYLLKTLRDTQLRYLKAVDDYVAFEQNSSQKLAKHTLASATSANLLLTSLLVGAVLVALLASWLISRSLWRQLGGEPADAVRLMEELAEGEVVSEFKLKDGDTSSLFAHIKTTAHNAVENLRVRNALDASATNMMIADANFRVVYANQAVTAMFQRAEQDIRQELPNFSARELLGSSIDVFHKNPAHPRQLMQSLRSVHQATIRIGGHTFSQTMTPIFSKTGKSLGAVVEWKDRTAELEVEREVADIVQAAANGDLTTRIALDNKRGFYRQLGEGVNQLLDVTTRGLGDIADVLGGLAEGDLTRSIDSEYQGLFGLSSRMTPIPRWNASRRLSATSRNPRRRSIPPRVKSPPVTPTCPAVPNNRPPVWKKPRPAWKKSPAPYARMQKTPEKPTPGHRCFGYRHPWRRGGGRCCGDHAGDQRQRPQDCRHHQCHRWHCLPDQYPGAECRGGSRSRWRAGPGFCRGGQ
ncbi:PAS domain-containing protein [Paludibacterium sp. dN 18-1]|uniref:PAS domain-containing protein n=1 Tax=Paludibacterium denitrificans TaxID=2675226 RepID=A0A844GBU1_9NEIS|nr:PAS domain-containing protein [Paludibacterium denitrificans]